MKIRKVPEAERVRKRDELLELVGLAGLGDRHAEPALGRPAAARGARSRARVRARGAPARRAVRRARRQDPRAAPADAARSCGTRLDVTTILVTHDQEEAFDLADRIGIIERGELLEVGSPEELYERPRTLVHGDVPRRGQRARRAARRKARSSSASGAAPGRRVVGAETERPDPDPAGARRRVVDGPARGLPPLGEGTIVERGLRRSEPPLPGAAARGLR